jgi:hypothetical protein
MPGGIRSHSNSLDRAMSWLDFLRHRKAIAQVLLTEDTVIFRGPKGREETIRLDELSECSIVTTDEGPYRDDVFFLLARLNPESGIAIPQSAEGFGELLARLQTLPGFDNQAVIQAMGSTTQAKFVCWKRARGGDR